MMKYIYLLLPILILCSCLGPNSEDLSKAIMLSKYQEVETYLTDCPDLLHDSSKTELPILNAIGENDLRMIELLMSKGASIESLSAQDMISAVRCKMLKSYENAYPLRILIDNGFDINSQDDEGNTVLHYAIQTRNQDIVQLLLDLGANTKIKNMDGNTPFRLAFQNNYGGMAIRILYNQSSINEITNSKDIEYIKLQDDEDEYSIGTIFKDVLDIYQVIFKAIKNDDVKKINTLITDMGPLTLKIDDKSCLQWAKKFQSKGVIKILNNNKHNQSLELIEAAKNGNIVEFKKLQKLGVKIDCVDAEWRTPLLWACCNNRTELAKYLIEQGAYIDNGGMVDHRPLSFAIINNNIELAKILIKHGANVTYNLLDPTIEAARLGRSKILQILIDNNSYIDKVSYNDHSPLFYAVSNGNAACTKVLLENCAKTSLSYSNQFMQIAINNRDTAMMNVLLNNGCAVDFLETYQLNKLTDDAKLKEYGLRLTKRLKQDSLFASFATQKRFNDIYNLIDQGYQVNAYQKGRITPLMWSIETGYMRIFNQLIDQGARINQPGKNGLTPLLYACALKRYDMILRLLEEGADVNKLSNYNDSALLLLVQRHPDNRTNEFNKCMVALLEKGADPFVKNSSGKEIASFYLSPLLQKEFKKHGYTYKRIRTRSSIFDDFFD